MERVTVEIENHIAVVTFNRAEKMNALDIPQFNAIIEAGEKVGNDPSVRVVVLRGAGRAFCAGLDVSSMGQNGNDLATSSLLPRTYGIANMWQQSAWVWRELPVPVI
ncbi:MAG: enoyl-CoA hydratase-related protein, partial [Bacteroidota bacterium]